MFAWVDFGEEHRRRTLDLVSLFNERDTRDELGLGVVRDGIADTLFPGTSTIQTRARYFLFIPWIYRRHEERGTPRAEIAKAVRRDEERLTDALAESDDTNGVIGLEARESLKRPASSVYWAGLEVWGIRLFRGYQEQFQRAFERFHPRDRRAGELPEGEEPARPVAWDPRLPEPPPSLPAYVRQPSPRSLESKGDQGSRDEQRNIGSTPPGRRQGDRSLGQGKATHVHGGVQAEDS